MALTSTPDDPTPNNEKSGKTLAERLKEPYQVGHISRWAHQLSAELVRIHDGAGPIQRPFPIHPSQIRLAENELSLTIEAADKDPWPDEAIR
ncbi:MAG: hypothetical protein P1V97_02655, partial [Planctomycetota bacterium]|nr:hypothetical protein [Planctomycetota bacterium]